MTRTIAARGMRDFLPADVRKRQFVIGVIREVYESYGFEPLETPAVENIETLVGKYGDEGNQLIFKILKRGDKLENELTSRDSAGDRADALADLALRYDLTVPLARVVANHQQALPKFFKRYQIQPVWRADRPARGRYREFYQCDVDTIGSSSMVVEAELILAVSEVLRRLGFADFTIRVNHREILHDILDTAGVPAERQTDALVAVDKLDKIGAAGVREELTAHGVSEEAVKILLGVFEQTQRIIGDGRDVNRTIVANLLQIVKSDVLSEVGKILRYAAGAPIVLDPSLARGLSYYTGAIMEINVPDFAGSLAGGGRYDGLIGMFGKEQIPACGFSLGLERILVVMDERKMFPPEIANSCAADVLVTIFSEETVERSLELAAELRSGGLSVSVYPEAEKLGKQMKFADAIGAAFVCIIGADEIANQSVTVKELESGDQTTIFRGEAARFISEKRAKRP